jgi:hypothetical protein
MNTITTSSNPASEMVQVLMLRKQMDAAKTNAEQLLKAMPPPPPAPAPHDGQIDTYA